MWSEEYKSILDEDVVKFRTTSGKEKSLVVKETVERVKDFHEKNHLPQPLPEDLEKVSSLSNLQNYNTTNWISVKKKVLTWMRNYAIAKMTSKWQDPSSPPC